MKWGDVREDLTGEPRPYETEVAYRVRWSLTWAALIAAAILYAWLVGTLAHQADLDPPTTTTTLETALAEERNVLHPSRGAARHETPTSPATTASTSWKETATTASRPASSPSSSILVEKPEQPQVTGYATAPTPTSWTVRVTCYGPPQFPAGKHTATGRPVGPGSLAVDPRLIPLGTELVLELPAGPLEVVADDTGGAVRGRHVDLWRQSCDRWPNPTAELHKKNV